MSVFRGDVGAYYYEYTTAFRRKAINTISINEMLSNQMGKLLHHNNA